MRRIIASVVLASMLSACSTTGGIYSESDPQNAEFSVVKTLLLPFAIAGAVVVGAAAGYAASQPEPTTVIVVRCPRYGRC